MKKREKAALLIQKYENLFKCPVCSRTMRMNSSQSLVCGLGHSFDLSKKGYLNLLMSGSAPSYPRELFESRRRVCEAGFYEPFVKAFAEAIKAYSPSGRLCVLDAGCGEGSHLNRVSALLCDEAYTFIGSDISKESIQIASGLASDILWCVADLARMPFQDGRLDMILNILSPANYIEFSRLLKDDGIVLKAVPGPGYLKEIREAVYSGTPKTDYNGISVREHFAKKLQVLEIQNVSYTFKASDEILPDIFAMTPLTRDVEGTEALFKNLPHSITVDLNILVGRKQ